MAKKEEKTNVMRLLEKAQVQYNAHTYDHDDGVIDGVGVARKLGQDPARVFKTLVTKGASGQYVVFCVPVQAELDLKKAARAAGEKSVEMIHVADINKVTGYIRGGCSPLGMKKRYLTVMDESILQHQTVMVSAGKIGFQIELAPADLLRLSAARTGPITAQQTAE